MKLVTRSLICSTFIVGLLPVAPVRAEQNEPRGDAQITPASAVGLRVLNDDGSVECQDSPISRSGIRPAQPHVSRP